MWSLRRGWRVSICTLSIGRAPGCSLVMERAPEWGPPISWLSVRRLCESGLVVQPYRVKERQSPRRRTSSTLPGRRWSPGCARGSSMACRCGRWPVFGSRAATAAATDAVAVVCLAFPLQPPRRAGKAAAPSRLVELEAVAVPTLVVQGTRDPFGVPPAGGQRTVVEVPGDHSLKADLAAVSAAVQSWLAALLASRASKM